MTDDLTTFNKGAELYEILPGLEVIPGSVILLSGAEHSGKTSLALLAASLASKTGLVFYQDLMSQYDETYIHPSTAKDKVVVMATSPPSSGVYESAEERRCAPIQDLIALKINLLVYKVGTVKLLVIDSLFAAEFKLSYALLRAAADIGCTVLALDGYGWSNSGRANTPMGNKTFADLVDIHISTRMLGRSKNVETYQVRLESSRKQLDLPPKLSFVKKSGKPFDLGC